ncbi:hypothetical protein [Arthrospira platensis]|uniref:hypothetical protein n=1 Tax=Limnospira TaxID=2596745 RepID=UPI0001C388A4|nr:hypothetical protein [Arthrospira platensis]AMW30513.1 hypothetical protein AP285_23800 [Arthrospira platensis YZ]KDR57428.1 hypothetical protein APPUASWS_010945 [Arthrospira platensis str. Paraca]MBD2709471.1 hypothetical protein [Arthrospira platensis FACHB-835]MDT9309864.1 hypothetical protein [Limnospira sp. Paracas R14]QQW28452.1 hypothetical protein AP9108_26215 [Arthrospira sp. PCC 9108]
MNILGIADSNLEPVDYSDILNKIIQQITQQQPFKISQNKNHLIIDLETITEQLIKQNIANPISSKGIIKSATVNFNSNTQNIFNQQIRQIRDLLKDKLQELARDNNHPDINSLTHSFIRTLQQINNQKFDLYYNFPAIQNVKTSELETRVNENVGSHSILKFHKLTISVRNINQFTQDLKQGLRNYIEEKLDQESSEDVEDTLEILDNLTNDKSSDFYKLQKVVDSESLGKLKKHAKICYLEYLAANLATNNNRDLVYLQDLIRRLKDMVAYIYDHDKQDGDYRVSYGGETINYRDWFSRSEVFDSLPIIPIISESLGETTSPDGSERTFTFGLKLKFNNPVQARGGKPAFDYYIEMINPEQEEFSQESQYYKKVLKIAFIYYFAFATRSNPDQEDYDPQSELTYNVRESFETHFLPIFQGTDEDEKSKCLRGIIQVFNQYNVIKKIENLKLLLHAFIKQSAILAPQNFPVKIGIYKGILESDIEKISNGLFFNQVVERNTKECLQYITIGDSSPDTGIFCQLPGNLKIEDIRYYQTSENQEFTIDYHGIDKIQKCLPVFFLPKSDPIRQKTGEIFINIPGIIFPYDQKCLNQGHYNSVQSFIYQFTMALLINISLRIILEDWKQVFLPIFRLHEGSEDKPFEAEKFMANLSKVISHLLNNKYRANSQGFRIKKLTDKLAKGNALGSLYSVLPRKFSLDQSADSRSFSLDKLALIVVSSAESDGLFKGDRQDRISTIFGEAIGIKKQSDNQIVVQLLKTFSGNYLSRNLYTEPSILIDLIYDLYHQSGLEYRHFLYIAKAPFTDNLHLTQVEDNDEDEFYFMSPTLIQSLQSGLPDIKIYPIFFNKYYVRKKKTLYQDSYSLKDTANLLNLVEDPSKNVVVFFNLFNGVSVKTKNEDDRFYNGVMSYATLLNIYQGVLDDQHIREGLIHDNFLKQDILQYLTFFHFYRFEKKLVGKNIQIKLDPYDRVIGDESLRKKCLFKHMNGKTDFNSLAFLSEVNSILYPQNQR